MSLDLVTAPLVEPISLEEAKAHLRVSHDDDDAIIQLYIQAARSYIDGEHGFLGRCLVTQTWLLTIDEFPADEIKIPLPPLQRVIEVAYDDPDGNGTVLDPQHIMWTLPVKRHGSCPSRIGRRLWML